MDQRLRGDWMGKYVEIDGVNTRHWSLRRRPGGRRPRLR
jgi:hypothetical protein